MPRPASLEKIAVAPLTLRPRLGELIEAEIAHARGRPAGADLGQAQRAGRSRHHRPALPRLAGRAWRSTWSCAASAACGRACPGLSENIRVKSIIGRFLEHGRIVCFGNGHKLPSTEAKVFISSADWMPRNFDWRVEALVPIENPTVHRQVLDEIMVANLQRRGAELELDCGRRSIARVSDDDERASARIPIS